MTEVNKLEKQPTIETPALNAPFQPQKKYVENKDKFIPMVTKDWEKQWDGTIKQERNKFIKDYGDQKVMSSRGNNKDNLKRRLESVKTVLQTQQEEGWRGYALDFKRVETEKKRNDLDNLNKQKVEVAEKVENPIDTGIKKPEVLDAAKSGEVTSEKVKQILTDTKTEIKPKIDEAIKVDNNNLQAAPKIESVVLDEVKKTPGITLPSKGGGDYKMPDQLNAKDVSEQKKELPSNISVIIKDLTGAGASVDAIEALLKSMGVNFKDYDKTVASMTDYIAKLVGKKK